MVAETRHFCVLGVAFCCAFLVLAQPTETPQESDTTVEQAPFSLKGEEMQATRPWLHCNNVPAIHVEGAATGAYPGTFTVDSKTFVPGETSGQFSADFIIKSSLGDVTGTESGYKPVGFLCGGVGSLPKPLMYFDFSFITQYRAALPRARSVCGSALG